MVTNNISSSSLYGDNRELYLEDNVVGVMKMGNLEEAVRAAGALNFSSFTSIPALMVRVSVSRGIAIDLAT